MIPALIEQEIWAGRAEMMSQTFGFGEQFILDVPTQSFVIVTGFTLSPRAWPINTEDEADNLNFLIQSLTLSTTRKSANFIYKPLFNKITLGTDIFYSANLISESDLYFIANEPVSIYTHLNDISAVTESSDTIPATGLLRPNLTAANLNAGVLYTNVLPGVNYAPLQRYGAEIGFNPGSQRDLTIKPFAYTPILGDPSNFPFLNINYALFKYTQPQQLT
jgi:hypothetical protein